MIEKEATSTTPASVLMVDDHEENLCALEAILESSDLRLVKAHSGTEALRRLLREDFALVLLDVAMPGMDGFEVASLVKARERSRHVPIIFLTAASKDISSVYKGYSVGAVDYLMKPLDPDVVRAKVAVFVELYRRGEQIAMQAEMLRDAEAKRRELEIAELRRGAEEKYKNLADAIPEIVFSAGPDGAVEYVNQRWIDFTGLTYEEALGSAWQKIVHHDDLARFLAEYQGAIARGASFESEARIKSAEGSYRWHRVKIEPERDKAGRIGAWLGVSSDVHDMKLIEEERMELLRRERAARADAEAALLRSDLLAQASNLFVGLFDEAGVVAGAASVAVERLAAWCVIDKLDDEGAVTQIAFRHADDSLAELGVELAKRREAPPGTRDVGAVLRGEAHELHAARSDAKLLASILGASSIEIIERLGAGSFVTVPLSARGQVLGAMTLVTKEPRSYSAVDLATASDLAQRAALSIDNARLYRNAQEAVKVRDEFLAIASHELKTPLSALTLQVQSLLLNLKRGVVEKDKVLKKLDVAHRQIDRLTRLINELLDVSRIEAGRLEIDREEYDLNGVVRDVLARFADELERSGCALEVDLGATGTACFDRLRMDQVVTNLLHNAMKYGRGKPVRVATSSDASTVRLVVVDHGIGISETDRKRIFGRFERAVSSRAYGGMGVGLYIVEQIVGTHGGTITVESEVGRGSRFTVALPRGVEQREMAAQPEAAAN